MASQVIQWVKNPPAMQETQEMWVRSLGREDPLEGGMATHSNILTWRIPWTEEPGGLQSIGSQRVGHNWSDWACTQAWFKTDKNKVNIAFSHINLVKNFIHFLEHVCFHFPEKACTVEAMPSPSSFFKSRDMPLNLNIQLQPYFFPYWIY